MLLILLLILLILPILILTILTILLAILPILLAILLLLRQRPHEHAHVLEPLLALRISVALSPECLVHDVALALLEKQHALLDRVFHDEADDVDGACLANAVNAVNRLVFSSLQNYVRIHEKEKEKQKKYARKGNNCN